MLKTNIKSTAPLCLRCSFRNSNHLKWFWLSTHMFDKIPQRTQSIIRGKIKRGQQSTESSHNNLDVNGVLVHPSSNYHYKVYFYSYSSFLSISLFKQQKVSHLLLVWMQCNRRSFVSEKTRTRTPFKRTPPKFLELPRGPSESKYLFRRKLCLSNGNGEIRRIPHVLGDRDGVIIVDHGSRRKESNLMLS